LALTDLGEDRRHNLIEICRNGMQMSTHDHKVIDRDNLRAIAGSSAAQLSQSAVRAEQEGFEVAIIDHSPSCDIRVSWECLRRVDSS
jgi:hypothetical protein